MTALDSFAGFSISDPKLLLPAESDGTNLVANATLPNPSVMTLEIVSPPTYICTIANPDRTTGQHHS